MEHTPHLYWCIYFVLWSYQTHFEGVSDALLEIFYISIICYYICVESSKNSEIQLLPTSKMMSRRGIAPPRPEYTVKPKGSQFNEVVNPFHFSYASIACTQLCRLAPLKCPTHLGRFCFAKEYFEGYELNVLANQKPRNMRRNIRIKTLVQSNRSDPKDLKIVLGL